MDYNKDNRNPILIVEDDEAIGEVMSIAISMETSYFPLLVTSGREALAALQTHQPCLVILDYILPDMTGIELYDLLHSQHYLDDVATILMSAGNHGSDAEERGIVTLDKPFEIDEFLHLVEKLSMPALCL